LSMRRKYQGTLITRPPRRQRTGSFGTSGENPGCAEFDKMYVPFAVLLFGSGIRNGVDGMNDRR